MASYFATTKACKFPLIIYTTLFIFSLTTTTHVSCFQYEVGGDKGRGWIKPDGTETETYNEWAEQNRFQIGDTIHFQYTNDSVVQVERKDYANCNDTSPISKSNNGSTVFEFDRSGFFYFISGEAGHCQAGQKMIIRVMAQSGGVHPSPARAPLPLAEGPTTARDGGDGGVTESLSPAAVNSTVMVSVTSYFLTMFIGVVVVLYLMVD